MTVQSAIDRLRAYNQGTAAPRQEDVEMSEEAAFQKLQERDQLEAARHCPSLASIPRFFKRKTSPRDLSTSVHSRVVHVAQQQFLDRQSEDLLSEDDLQQVLMLLKEHTREFEAERGEVIDYCAFAAIRDELLQKSHRFQSHFKTSCFLRHRDSNNRIPIVPFFLLMVRKNTIRQLRLKLMEYDTTGSGFLCEKDMENFIFELIPLLPQLSSLQEEFYPFYVFTAVRKFFFFHDPRRTGRIRIRELLLSPLLPNLQELQRDAPQKNPEASSRAGANWFSMESTLRVYGIYLDLDLDQNGMLSKAELRGYGGGMVTGVFIDRIFECYQTYRDTETGEMEMDYKAFLDFVLAMEDKNSPQSVRYFWRALDIHHTGRIDGLVIRYFFQAIAKTLRGKKLEVAVVDDVIDEIFDMVRPQNPELITLEDMLKCKQAGTVVSMLIDAAAFWRYDQREHILLGDDEDDDMEDAENTDGQVEFLAHGGA